MMTVNPVASMTFGHSGDKNMFNCEKK